MSRKKKWKHFTYDEFECPCCGENQTSEELIDLLDKAREIAGIPFYITSGFRCFLRNTQVEGKPRSAHLKGLAADIRCTSSTNRFKIVSALLRVGFKRIGIHNTFVHADIDGSLPHPLIFLYNRKQRGKRG